MNFDPWIIPVGYALMVFLTSIFHVVCYGFSSSLERKGIEMEEVVIVYNDEFMDPGLFGNITNSFEIPI